MSTGTFSPPACEHQGHILTKGRTGLLKERQLRVYIFPELTPSKRKHVLGENEKICRSNRNHQAGTTVSSFTQSFQEHQK